MPERTITVYVSGPGLRTDVRASADPDRDVERIRRIAINEIEAAGHTTWRDFAGQYEAEVHVEGTGQKFRVSLL